MNERLYTIAEAGQYLGVSRSTVYALIRQGELRVTIVGERKRVLGSSIEELVARGLESVDSQE